VITIKNKKKYTHLTLEERVELYAKLEAGMSFRDIGKDLHRSHTSLTREVNRNIKYGNEYLNNRYSPCKAQELADKRARLQREKASLKDPFIFSYTVEHLDPKYGHCWTPEEIAGRLSLEHPEYSIHHESIYRFIYVGRGKPLKLWRYLRLHRKKRMKHHGRKVKSEARFTGALPIEQRPVEANLRLEKGHWESDNMGAIKTDKTVVSVTVERISLLSRLHKLPDLTAGTKQAALINQLEKEPLCMRRSLTSDRGPENSDDGQFTAQTEMPHYLCTAYHSWERGTNENTIGRLRYFTPKGSSVDQLTQKDFLRYEEIMNNTPRKALGWLTPNEAYCMLCEEAWDPRNRLNYQKR